MSKQLNIRIGDVSISLKGDIQTGEADVIPAFRPFVTGAKTDIGLQLHRGAPGLKAQEKVFDCPPIWTLYRHNGTLMIEIYGAYAGLQQILVLPDHFQTAHLYFPDASRAFPDPFQGPALELLMVHYLARTGGVIVHGCGVAVDQQGMLFVGESGAGKSTLATLWAQHPNVEVLSDDRTIVRKKRGQFWMYGTPWHGEAKFGSPRRVRLKHIFFLRHGQANRIRDITGAMPVRHLLTCSFPPYWDAAGTAITMDFFNELSAVVHCHELEFVPESSVIDFLQAV